MRLTEQDVVEMLEDVTRQRLRFRVGNGWICRVIDLGDIVFDEVDVARMSRSVS